MGMTIDDCMDYYNRSFAIGDTASDRQHNDILEMTISIMRKYQKIQEILNSAGYIKNGTVYSYTYDEDSRVKHIREVIEDANNKQAN